MERSMDSSWVLYRRLWQYVRPYRGAFALAMLGYVIFASGQPMMTSYPIADLLVFLQTIQTGQDI